MKAAVSRSASFSGVRRTVCSHGRTASPAATATVSAAAGPGSRPANRRTVREPPQRATSHGARAVPTAVTASTPAAMASSGVSESDR